MDTTKTETRRKPEARVAWSGTWKAWPVRVVVVTNLAGETGARVEFEGRDSMGASSWREAEAERWSHILALAVVALSEPKP